MSLNQFLGPWDPGWGECVAHGGRRPTNWGSGGEAPRNLGTLAAIPFGGHIGITKLKQGSGFPSSTQGSCGIQKPQNIGFAKSHSEGDSSQVPH